MRKQKKKTHALKRSGSKRAKFPVPAWMDEELKPTAERLNLLERHNLAAKLERQAEQLREMNPPPIKAEMVVIAEIRPNAKRALLAFFDAHSIPDDRHFTEVQKLNMGARWFLEWALPLVALVSEQTNCAAHYRDAEGIDNSVYSERLIDDALLKWQENRRDG